MHVIQTVLERTKSRLDRIWHRFDGLPSWWHGGQFWRGKGIAMDQGVSGGTALDLAQTNQVSALEISVSMLELPERRVWRSCVEDVAHCDTKISFQGDGLFQSARDAPL